MDFAENFTYSSADEVQSAYWNSSSVTLHPVVIYYKTSNESNLKHKNYVFVSDDLKHNINTVYAILKKLVPKIKEDVPDLQHIHYWTDSPSSQYRNKSAFYIVSDHESLLGTSASWNYFETHNIPNNSTVKTLIDLVCQRFVGKLQTFDGITLDPQHRISHYSQNGKKINLKLIEERVVDTNETDTRVDFQIGADFCTFTDADIIVRKALMEINTAEELTFILNKYKICFLHGRPLGCTAENATIEGETSPIFVRRGYEYVDAIDELANLDNIRFPFEVGYYGEEAVDLVGPRTDFLTASINYIKEHLIVMEDTGDTGSIRKDLHLIINKGYYVAGLLIGLSAIQNGPCADFLDCLIRSETWFEGQEHVQMFKLGLKKTGLLQLLERKPSSRFLFQKRQGMLSVSKLINCLQPNFSEDGSNRRLKENNSYKVFIKYLREVAAGRRPSVSLKKVLQFISAYEEETCLGFPMIPTVSFAELPGNIPTSNTCIFQLTLPLLESANQDVFEKFDLAFMNAFFG